MKKLTKDLRGSFLRSPREKLSGYVIAARCVDKCRSFLLGLSGVYNYWPCSLASQWFSFTGITSETFKFWPFLNRASDGLGISNWRVRKLYNSGSDLYCPTSFLDSAYLRVDHSFCRKFSDRRVSPFQGRSVTPARCSVWKSQLPSFTLDPNQFIGFSAPTGSSHCPNVKWGTTFQKQHNVAQLVFFKLRPSWTSHQAKVTAKYRDEQRVVDRRIEGASLLMSDYWCRIQGHSIALACILLMGCASGEDVELRVHHTGGGEFATQPKRVAILTPSTSDPLLVNAYSRLDAHTDYLFQRGLGSQIVERSDLAVVHEEQHRQYFEPAEEETTVRLGRLLGADILIVYRIKIPELRERLFTEQADQLSPVTIFGKAVRVETAEEVWTHAVTVEIGRIRHGLTEVSLDHAIWHALNQGVDEMLAALAEAVISVQLKSEREGQERR